MTTAREAGAAGSGLGPKNASPGCDSGQSSAALCLEGVHLLEPARWPESGCGRWGGGAASSFCRQSGWGPLGPPSVPALSNKGGNPEHAETQ